MSDLGYKNQDELAEAEGVLAQINSNFRFYANIFVNAPMPNSVTCEGLDCEIAGFKSSIDT